MPAVQISDCGCGNSSHQRISGCTRFVPGSIERSAKPGMRLQAMDGPVSLQPGGVDDWVAANLNRPLTTADRILGGRRCESGTYDGHSGAADGKPDECGADKSG